MNWQDWLQVTAARLRNHAPPRPSVTHQSAFRPLPMLMPSRMPQLMNLPLPVQTLLQNANPTLSVEQQLQAFYSLQLCVLAANSVGSASATTPVKPQQSPVVEVDERQDTVVSNEIQRKDNLDKSPSNFSIDDLLRQQSPCLSSIKSKRINYTVEELQTSDGRCKRRLFQDSVSVSPPTNSPTSTSTTVRAQSEESQNQQSSQHRHICGECGKSYATSSNLSRHKQTHRPLTSPHARSCDYCGRVYVSMPALSMHLLTHKASHKCDTCGKIFSRPWLLKGHLRSHTGQKPFGCAHCGKAFADRSNLRAHMHTHTGVKKYQCEKCGKLFSLKSYLNKHIEQVCGRKLKSSPVEFNQLFD